MAKQRTFKLAITIRLVALSLKIIMKKYKKKLLLYGVINLIIAILAYNLNELRILAISTILANVFFLAGIFGVKEFEDEDE